jgi:hypothetical protein
LQALAASFLSNLEETYSWPGESYIVAWLAKKAGFTSTSSHKNTIRNIDWLDSCLQVSYKTFFHSANKTLINWYQTVKYGAGYRNRFMEQ